MSTRPRTFAYAVTVDEAWAAHSDRDGAPLAVVDDDAWTPEHLVLAGLVRCSLGSLRYHCRRAEIVLTSSASARGTVTLREEDGRFAFVEITVDANVTFDPKPDEAGVADLLTKAERDCFVGASLTAKPIYAWSVT